MPRKPASNKNKKQTGAKKSTSLKSGDKVEWQTPQGKTKGTVKQKVSKSTTVKGHKAKASKQEPQFLVESEKTGKKAAHKAKTLKKVKS
jgi:hypothetical protein